ncbi:tail fiber protein [Pseudomonas sp. N40(2020)]|uniref:tail fiber protein n=1 Tax=Pseudomonas sp. N40(2020) TaxID=2767798 RepID=UPI001656D1A9|nr:tail fiber protein [Pseudomonas sp. N40(2020)]MBC8997744.1 tail fiber protein [Pseudomonas sp. N40(2020)]
MDYPKSVPSVGLVDGRFVDENPVAGTPGSLIPAVWGNSVTQEILSVIIGGGLVASEGDNNQLFKAIQAIVGNASPMRSVITRVGTSRLLTGEELGLVLIDAGAGSLSVRLPPANASLGVRDVIVRRVDNSGNRLVVQSSSGDVIKFHTHLNASGYPFLVLMGAGDWWHLRSDIAGNWWPVGRLDGSSLGYIAFETTLAVLPGGYAALNGSLLNRSEWPWLWDHAQQSGMLRSEADRGGAWTPGDGATTFRLPEARGEFLRVLAEGGLVDTGRAPGSWQKGSLVQGDNGIADNILFATHIISQKTQLGLDMGNYADYAGATVKYITPAAPVTPIADSELLNHGGITRPRNIAYPGRIKLI